MPWGGQRGGGRRGTGQTFAHIRWPVGLACKVVRFTAFTGIVAATLRNNHICGSTTFTAVEGMCFTSTYYLTDVLRKDARANAVTEKVPVRRGSCTADCL